ncbi:hypothetical protein O9992_16580 [Vibrio lentus]|nr:hypothetical protein [Vibrio lentus]
MAQKTADIVLSLLFCSQLLRCTLRRVGLLFYFVDVGDKGINEVNSVLVVSTCVFEPVLPDEAFLYRVISSLLSFQHGGGITSLL